LQQEANGNGDFVYYAAKIAASLCLVGVY